MAKCLSCNRYECECAGTIEFKRKAAERDRKESEKESFLGNLVDSVIDLFD